LKLSTNSRYGLRALVDLAANYNGTPLSLCAIAEHQHISESYLEQAFSTLRKAGLVKSAKGAQGGYTSPEAPEALKVGTILRALEGDLSIIDDSAAYTGEDLIKRCVRENVWDAIDRKVAGTVDSITLADLAEEYKRMRGNTLTYHI
jgi:Rrf2 family transcriptional regulator, cysteine metabolism repressor